ncbi:hypothetical protein [Roseibium sp. MMSF_3412]|uniref:hypothetical protein n=1 Tax=Roseibium sp. MMSF_3412 TaxID=3046712 RepID=UPI00273DABD1|nr:hypothetical protein [Roseibium sp. MMSF_3412]
MSSRVNGTASPGLATALPVSEYINRFYNPLAREDRLLDHRETSNLTSRNLIDYTVLIWSTTFAKIGANMSLFKWISNQVGRPAIRPTHIWVKPQNTRTTDEVGTTADEGQHYVRLWISELFLEKDRVWFTERSPIVHTSVGLEYGDNKVELTNLSGKPGFDIKTPDLGKSILRNYRLTPLLPFNGGTIEIDAGLVSVRVNNLVQDFAAVVSDVAGLLNAPQASQAIGLAQSVASGVQKLLGAGEAETKLYFHDTLAGSSVKSGFLFLTAQSEGTQDPEKIWVTADGARYGSGPADLGPLPSQDYIVLRLEVASSRDDWRSFTAISKPLEEAITASQLAEDTKAALLLSQAKAAALASEDLTRLDKRRAILGIQTEFDEFGLGLAGPVRAGPSINVLESAVARVTPEALESFDDSALEASAKDLGVPLTSGT